MNTQQQLVHQITDIAMAISLSNAAIVNVEFSSVANHLRITVKAQPYSKPKIDECIPLCEPNDGELSKRRTEARLRSVIGQLRSIQMRGETPPPVAA